MDSDETGAHRMRLPADPSLADLLARYEREDARDLAGRGYVGQIGYGEYRAAVIRRLARGGSVYAAELTAHYEAELRTAWSERSPLDVVALSMMQIAENWDLRGICHLFDDVDVDAAPVRLDIEPVDDGVVIRLDSGPDFIHEGGSCALSATMRGVADALGVAVDDNGVEIRMHARSLRITSERDAGLDKLALVYAGWTV